MAKVGTGGKSAFKEKQEARKAESIRQYGSSSVEFRSVQEQLASGKLSPESEEYKRYNEAYQQQQQVEQRKIEAQQLAEQQAKISQQVIAEQKTLKGQVSQADRTAFDKNVAKYGSSAYGELKKSTFQQEHPPKTLKGQITETILSKIPVVGKLVEVKKTKELVKGISEVPTQIKQQYIQTRYASPLTQDTQTAKAIESFATLPIDIGKKILSSSRTSTQMQQDYEKSVKLGKEELKPKQAEKEYTKEKENIKAEIQKTGNLDVFKKDKYSGYKFSQEGDTVKFSNPQKEAEINKMYESAYEKSFKSSLSDKAILAGYDIAELAIGAGIAGGVGIAKSSLTKYGYKTARVTSETFADTEQLLRMTETKPRKLLVQEGNIIKEKEFTDNLIKDLYKTEGLTVVKTRPFFGLGKAEVDIVKTKVKTKLTQNLDQPFYTGESEFTAEVLGRGKRVYKGRMGDLFVPKEELTYGISKTELELPSGKGKRIKKIYSGEISRKAGETNFIKDISNDEWIYGKGTKREIKITQPKPIEQRELITKDLIKIDNIIRERTLPKIEIYTSYGETMQKPQKVSRIREELKRLLESVNFERFKRVPPKQGSLLRVKRLSDEQLDISDSLNLDTGLKQKIRSKMEKQQPVTMKSIDNLSKEIVREKVSARIKMKNISRNLTEQRFRKYLTSNLLGAEKQLTKQEERMGYGTINQGNLMYDTTQLERQMQAQVQIQTQIEVPIQTGRGRGREIIPQTNIPVIPRIPRIPRMKVPKIPLGIPRIPDLYGGVSKKYKQRGYPTNEELLYVPDFTSKALGLKKLVSEKELRNILSTKFTGLELRKELYLK